MPTLLPKTLKVVSAPLIEVVPRARQRWALGEGHPPSGREARRVCSLAHSSETRLARACKSRLFGNRWLPETM